MTAILSTSTTNEQINKVKNYEDGLTGYSREDFIGVALSYRYAPTFFGDKEKVEGVGVLGWVVGVFC